MSKMIENKNPTLFNGSVWETKNFGKVKIIGKSDRKNSHNQKDYYFVEFEDGAILEAKSYNIKIGSIKNPNKDYHIKRKKIIDQGEYNIKDNTLLYRRWSNLLYKENELCDEWKSFQCYCKDMISLLDELNIKESELTLYKIHRKDSLKIYSKDNITFRKKS